MNEEPTTSVHRRPLIGITTRLDLTQNTFYLRRYYAEAIAAAGGTPVYIPLLRGPEALISLAERLDGVVLSGSDSDLDPRSMARSRDRNLVLLSMNVMR
jgi:gamma-glutamyl-gamma-aminobutyrate hydrolase PuuD